VHDPRMLLPPSSSEPLLSLPASSLRYSHVSNWALTHQDDKGANSPIPLAKTR
jgi:hypothetical protein